MTVLLNREPMASEEVKIHVIVPYYNCHEYLDRCLGSVMDQTHKKLNVVLIDDASSDGGSGSGEDIANKSGWTYHRNDENMKCPHNIWLGVQKTGAHPQDVIFLLDGDDYLPHERVLARTAELFAEADTWMTYGQYMANPPDWRCTPAVPPPHRAVFERNFRQINIFFNHPIVFRRFLFDAIPLEEFKDNEGNWFQVGYDRAIFYPMIELATSYPQWKKQELHWQFINEVSYVYNSENPISDWRVTPNNGYSIIDQVHTRPPLKPLRYRTHV